MARGTAKFDPKILQKLRAGREVEGRRLSAADLAQMLGTSKTRVLAYESGRSVPEPGRIAQLAKIFRVHPRELYEPSKGRHDEIRDLRCYAGLTAAELAEQLGVSRATYRDIERMAILPARDDGTLPLRLADALHIPLPMIHRALDNHPVAAERREAIAGHLTEIFVRAHVQYQPAVVNPDEPVLVEITTLLRRPASVVCRLVNHELTLYRRLIKRRGGLELSVAYAQSARAAADASAEAEDIEATIARYPSYAASTLVRFLAEAMTSQQWQTMVLLMEQGFAWVAPSDDEESAQMWGGLMARRFVTEDRVTPEGTRMAITKEGWRRCNQYLHHYACLYPRVSAPRVRFTRPGSTSQVVQRRIDPSSSELRDV